MTHADCPMGLSDDDEFSHMINVSLHKTVMTCIENGQFHREGDSLRLAYNIVLTAAGEFDDDFVVEVFGRHKMIYRKHLPATCEKIDAAYRKAQKPVRSKLPVNVPPVVAPEPEEPEGLEAVAFLVLMLIVAFVLLGISK